MAENIQYMHPITGADILDKCIYGQTERINLFFNCCLDGNRASNYVTNVLRNLNLPEFDTRHGTRSEEEMNEITELYKYTSTNVYAVNGNTYEVPVIGERKFYLTLNETLPAAVPAPAVPPLTGTLPVQINSVLFDLNTRSDNRADATFVNGPTMGTIHLEDGTHEDVLFEYVDATHLKVTRNPQGTATSLPEIILGKKVTLSLTLSGEGMCESGTPHLNDIVLPTYRTESIPTYRFDYGLSKTTLNKNPACRSVIDPETSAVDRKKTDFNIERATLTANKQDLSERIRNIILYGVDSNYVEGDTLLATSEGFHTTRLKAPLFIWDSCCLKSLKKRLRTYAKNRPTDLMNNYSNRTIVWSGAGFLEMLDASASKGIVINRDVSTLRGGDAKVWERLVDYGVRSIKTEGRIFYFVEESTMPEFEAYAVDESNDIILYAKEKGGNVQSLDGSAPTPFAQFGLLRALTKENELANKDGSFCPMSFHYELTFKRKIVCPDATLRIKATECLGCDQSMPTVTDTSGASGGVSSTEMTNALPQVTNTVVDTRLDGTDPAPNVLDTEEDNRPDGSYSI